MVFNDFIIFFQFISYYFLINKKIRSPLKITPSLFYLISIYTIQFRRMILRKQFFRHQRPYGIQLAVYHIYADICTIKHINTRMRLYSATADIIVNINAAIKTIEEILLSLSFIFSNCLLNPIKNPVLHNQDSFTQLMIKYFQLNILWRIWLDFPQLYLKKIQKKVFEQDILYKQRVTQSTANSKSNKSFSKGQTRKTRLFLLLPISEGKKL